MPHKPPTKRQNKSPPITALLFPSECNQFPSNGHNFPLCPDISSTSATIHREKMIKPSSGKARFQRPTLAQKPDQGGAAKMPSIINEAFVTCQAHHHQATRSIPPTHPPNTHPAALQCPEGALCRSGNEIAFMGLYTFDNDFDRFTFFVIERI